MVLDLKSLQIVLEGLIIIDTEEKRLNFVNELNQEVVHKFEQVAKTSDPIERRNLLQNWKLLEGGEDQMETTTSTTRELQHKQQSLFYPFVIPPDMEPINPRDTLSRRCCGERVSRFFFQIYFRNQFTASFIMFMSVVGAICLLLGLTALVDVPISWGSFLCTPFLFCYFALLNRHILHVLRKEFEFWVLFILSTASCASMLDMVWDDPTRYISVLFLYICSVALVASDARPVFRKKAYGYRLIFLGATLVYAFLLVLYHLNLWKNYRQTLYQIGIGNGVDFHVPSTGMGCAATLCILTGKYAWVILRSKDINPMVVVRAPIVLRPLEQIPAHHAIPTTKTKSFFQSSFLRKDTATGLTKTGSIVSEQNIVASPEMNEENIV